VFITGLLRDERDKARVSQQRAEKAENDAKALLQRAEQAEQESTIRAYLLEAAAHRRKGQMGQRFQALEAREKALALHPSAELLHQLRHEAVACLALPDARVVKEWVGWPAGTVTVDFDDTLEHYARSDKKGMISFRRVVDDAEICALKAVHLQQSNLFFRNTLGLAYYRAGQYQKAIDTLLPNVKNKANRFLGWDLFFLA